MRQADARTRSIAKRLAIVTAVVCVLIFAPSIMPAGFAIYMLDSPGSGFLHELFVWGTVLVLLLMPIIAILGSFVPWRAYKRDKYRLTIIWSLCTLALIPYWAMWAYIVYFT
jgi:hypothetical protein